MLVTVNNRLKFEIIIVHDLSCHPICIHQSAVDGYTEVAAINSTRMHVCALCVAQDGVAAEGERGDAAVNSRTVHLNNAVSEAADHSQSTDHNQCVVLSDSIPFRCRSVVQSLSDLLLRFC